MRDEIVRKIEKWQEPPPAKIIKPLKAPDAEGKKRRGGRRLRKMKERYGLTDMRKVRGEGGADRLACALLTCRLALTHAFPCGIPPIVVTLLAFVCPHPPTSPLAPPVPFPIVHAPLPTQAANRINFNQPEEEYMDGDEVMGLGVLGKGQGSGRLRIVAKEQKMKRSAKTGEDRKGG